MSDTSDQKKAAAKAAAETVELVAIAGFTIYEGTPEEPKPREVKAGEVFTVPVAELPRWQGRGRPKSLDADAPAAGGLSVTTDHKKA